MHDLTLFIHGLGCTSTTWRDSRIWVCTLDWRCLSPNLPGFGGQPAPANFGYRMEEQAEWLAQQLQPIPFERLHVVAHSMGGAIGCLLYRHMADRFSSFVNIEGNLVGEDCGLISRKVADLDFDTFQQTLFPHLKEMWGATGFIGINLDRTTPEAFYKSCLSLVHWSESGELLRLFEQISCRKAYVYGARNQLRPALGQLDPALCVAVPDCGHFPMEENPDFFYDWLRRFLNRPDPFAF